MPMNAAHEAHLARILASVTHDIDAKYRKGQIEHGGSLWLKPGMLDNAIEEVLDLAVYLYTLKEQLTRPPGTYDDHQAEATLIQCTSCQREWYRTNPNACDSGLCVACQTRA